jgi:peptide/nickel transport system permease protein/oligopeptide transport system permease protein
VTEAHTDADAPRHAGADATASPTAVVVPTDTEGPTPKRPRSSGSDVWRRFRRNKLAMAGLAIIVLLILAAAFARFLTPYGPYEIDTTMSRAEPSAEHWFGTDLLGRDLLTRVLYGAQTSLQVGLMAVAIALSIGLVAGALAGFYGGKLDTVIMRLTDVFLAFPYLLLAISVIMVLGRGKGTVIAVIGFLGWMAIARLFRSSVLSVKETEYVEAARAVGCSDWRIITRHILPNAIQPVIVYATIFVGTAVLSEAALSFLSVGVTEPTAAWGLMVADGRRFLFSSPHMLFFPGAAIFLTVMAFVFVGDGLRDALDPKLR